MTVFYPNDTAKPADKLAWLVEQSRAMAQPAPTAPAADRLLTLAEAAETVPPSKKTLLRAAQRGDDAFLKVEGRWMVYASDLHTWIRERAAAAAADREPTAPRPRQRRRGAGMRARVLETAE